MLGNLWAIYTGLIASFCASTIEGCEDLVECSCHYLSNFRLSKAGFSTLRSSQTHELCQIEQCSGVLEPRPEGLPTWVWSRLSFVALYHLTESKLLSIVEELEK